MRVGRGVHAVIFVVIALAGAHLAPAQEATSANLPDQFRTGEMIQIEKPKKKKKAESDSQTVATTKEDTAPVPEQMPGIEEMPKPIAPAEEKKAEPKRSSASLPPNQKPSASIEQASPAEEPAIVAVPSERKPRPRKRQRPALQPEPVSVSAPVPMSLSVAQSIAIAAPLPEYTYEMKRRNLAGSGICVVTVDTATGAVTNANMFQSTGNPLLDKLTIQTFKSWRFKPGTVSQVRVPISYE